MNDHGRPTPHRIGNDGEAHIDTHDDWECLPVWSKLSKLASDLDASGSVSPSRIESSVDLAELDRVIDTLEEIADDLFKECARRGIVL